MEILPDSLHDKRISSLNHHMIIWTAAFPFHWLSKHCLIFTLERVGWCLFLCVCVRALFYCQRLPAIWFLLKPRCHVCAWCMTREKEDYSSPLSPTLGCALLWDHQVKPSLSIKFPNLSSWKISPSSSPPSRDKEQSRAGMGFRVPQFPSLESGCREWVRIVMKPSPWH